MAMENEKSIDHHSEMEVKDSRPSSKALYYVDHTHKIYSELLDLYVSEGLVDYQGLLEVVPSLTEYLDSISKIPQEAFEFWPKSKQIALLLNLYNAATIQLILNHYPIKSIQSIQENHTRAWSIPFINLFGNKLSLDDLEHNYIRKRYSDPRLSFALACGAKGYPPLRNEAYQFDQLDIQLENQIQNYLKKPEGLRISHSTNKVFISPLFRWYKNDFKAVQKNVIQFIEEYSDANFDKKRIFYLKCDWSLNESPSPKKNLN